MEQIDLKFTLSNREKPILVLNNFLFLHKQTNKDGTSAWRCKNHAKYNCSSSCTTYNQQINRYPAKHDKRCVTSTEAEIQFKNANGQIKKRSREETYVKISRIFHQEVSKIIRNGLEINLETAKAIPVY